MTPIAVRADHYTFWHVARMEWIKMRSLRSTWLTLALTVAAAVGLAAAVGADTKDASGDLTNNALAGIAPGLLLTGALGVLTVTGEFTSGMIRATLAATPNRALLLAGKAAVFGVVALAVGEIAAFISFFVGNLTLPDQIAAPTLGEPGVLRAVLMAGTSYCLVGLLGLGLGAIIRHTPAAIGVLVGGVYIAAQALAAVAHQLIPYMPIPIVANSLSTTQPVEGRLPPWEGLGLLSVYAAVVLGVGGWLLARRDA